MAPIEPARPADFSAIAALNIAAYQGYARFLEPGGWPRMQANISNIESRAASTEFLVVRDQGRIVGSVGYTPTGKADPAIFDPSMAALVLLAVDPDYRGLGIGRELTEACIERARRDHARTLALFTSELMRTAQHLYRAVGFTQDKELPPRLGVRAFRFVLPLQTAIC